MRSGKSFNPTSAFVFVYRALKAPPEFVGFVAYRAAVLSDRIERREVIDG